MSKDRNRKSGAPLFAWIYKIDFDGGTLPIISGENGAISLSIYIPIEGSEAGSSSERSDTIALAGDSHEKAVASAFAQALYHDAKGGLMPNFAMEGKISPKGKHS